MLKALRMRECNLEMIEDGAFSNMKQFLEFDLSKYNFEKLERNILSELLSI